MLTKKNSNAKIDGPGSNPDGFCMCGCGRKTKLAPQGHAFSGDVAGKPQRYIQGHRAVFKKSLPVEPRLWKRVIKSLNPDGCWEWQGSKDSSRYGQLSVEGEMILVHRISFELHNGPIPEGKKVLHSCDNPPCVRPDHLFLGDDIDNALDRNRKGRQAKGERIHAAKLTAGDVIHMRSLRKSGTHLTELAKQFGVCSTHVWMVCARRLWKHVQ